MRLKVCRDIDVTLKFGINTGREKRPTGSSFGENRHDSENTAGAVHVACIGPFHHRLGVGRNPTVFGSMEPDSGQFCFGCAGLADHSLRQSLQTDADEAQGHQIPQL